LGGLIFLKSGFLRPHEPVFEEGSGVVVPQVKFNVPQSVPGSEARPGLVVVTLDLQQSHPKSLLYGVSHTVSNFFKNFFYIAPSTFSLDCLEGGSPRFLVPEGEPSSPS